MEASRGTMFTQVASRSLTSVVARRSPVCSSGTVISATRTSVAKSGFPAGHQLGGREHRAVVILFLVERVDHVLEALLHDLALHLLRRRQRAVLDRELLVDQRQLLRLFVAGQVV